MRLCRQFCHAAYGSLPILHASVPRQLGDAREDWKVGRALAEVLGVPLPYDSQPGVRRRLAEVAPSFGALNTVQVRMGPCGG